MVGIRRKAFGAYNFVFILLLLLGLGTHLFVKVPRPRDSEGTFRSSSQPFRISDDLLN